MTGAKTKFAMARVMDEAAAVIQHIATGQYLDAIGKISDVKAWDKAKDAMKEMKQLIMEIEADNEDWRYRMSEISHNRKEHEHAGDAAEHV